MTAFKYQRNVRAPQLRGFSLLEMVMAAALVSGTVVPALVVIRDAMGHSRELHTRNLLASFAVLKLEEQSAFTAKYWSNATDADTFASYGQPGIGFKVSRSDAAADGGIVGQLMHIHVTVFEDIDGNILPDANEIQETYRTKVAKMNSYDNEAM